MSCYLTSRIGVAGVIWGTVLTTFFSNLLVPGLYVFRVLEIDPRTYLKRTLSPPLAGAAGARRGDLAAAPVDAGHAIRASILWTRALPLLFHLAVGTLAYIGGYLLVPVGSRRPRRAWGKLRRR